MKIITIDKRSLENKFISSIRENNLEEFISCLEQGVDIHYQNDHALFNAIHYNNLEILKILIEKSKAINFEIFIKACKCGYLDIVKFLYSKISHIYIEDIEDDIERGFIEACIEGHFEVVKYLVDNVGIYLDYNYALLYSCVNGKLDIVKYLVKNGASVDTIDHFNKMIIINNGYSEILDFLKHYENNNN